LEPFGPTHETKLIGQLCATIANFSGAKRKDDEPWEPEDFVPNPLIEKEVVEERKQTPEEMMMALKAAVKKPKRKQKK
jgi:hypothetical protein